LKILRHILASPTIRSPRSEYVRYRVGQVIRHKLYGYRAVIIGWDEIASAPDEWLDEHHQDHPVSLPKKNNLIDSLTI
jgi:hemimethylated DNA binding protein